MPVNRPCRRWCVNCMRSLACVSTRPRPCTWASSAPRPLEVQAELFRVDSAEAVVPAAEIEEVVWLAADQAPAMQLAPLTRDLILPLYRQALNAPR